MKYTMKQVLQIAMALVALVGMALASDGGAPATPAADSGSDQTPALQQRDPRYKLQRGDQMQLEFPFTSEFNQNVTVQPDGFINLKGVDDLKVEGLTTPEAVGAIEKQYAKILHDPVVTIVLSQFVAPYFTAIGKVAHPGKYNLYGDTTVTQGIAIAGGFSDQAKHSEVVLFRRVSNDWVQATKVDVKGMLNSGNLAEDLHLQPGDMLYIPKNRISKIKPFIPFGLFRVDYAAGF